MRRLVFATHNANKVAEIRNVLPSGFEVLSLADCNFHDEIDEPYLTFEENAAEKCRVVFEKTGLDCFSEDTGLEVEALDGAPGVISSRYAQGDVKFADNIEKLLHNLQHHTNKKARFKTVICYIKGGTNYFFEGICTGKIIEERRGDNGFGYDPVFIPDGSEKTFAEMSMEEKAKFSHRKKAMFALLNFLNDQHGQD